MKILERVVSIVESQAGDEAFVMPVVEIDGVARGAGRLGTVVTRMQETNREESPKAVQSAGTR